MPTTRRRSILAGYRSLVAVPVYDGGDSAEHDDPAEREPAAFDREDLPERVWMSNLFGRATQNLVLMREVKEAYDVVDRELKVVGEIQRSLLPTKLPTIPTLELAAAYQTSQRAGGDYYDFFPLPNGLWGLLIADVSGHGTPAAVLMAVTHSIAHTCRDPKTPPSRLLRSSTRRLAGRLHHRHRQLRHRLLRRLRPGQRARSASQRRPPAAAVRVAAGGHATGRAAARCSRACRWGSTAAYNYQDRP